MLDLIAECLAGTVINGPGEGIPQDIVLDILAAMVGGWLFNVLGTTGLAGFNLWSLSGAVAGAIVVLVIWHAVRVRISHTWDMAKY